MDANPDDDVIRQVEISIMPREEVLAGLSISSESFETAVVDAMNEREMLAESEDVEGEDIPPLEEMVLVIEGVTYKLEDLAEVEVKSWDG